MVMKYKKTGQQVKSYKTMREKSKIKSPKTRKEIHEEKINQDARDLTQGDGKREGEKSNKEHSYRQMQVLKELENKQ